MHALYGHNTHSHVFKLMMLHSTTVLKYHASGYSFNQYWYTFCLMQDNNLQNNSIPHQARPEKASVIDLGSNSIKMVNYNIALHNLYKPYHQESDGIKLAEGVADGAIQESHMNRTVDALKLFRNIINFEKINYEIAVATSIVRDAKNQDFFMERIHKETGFDFKILSEREEALYSYAGAMRSLNLPSVVFFDIGGGSIEIVSSTNFQIHKVTSLRLGALLLTKKFSPKSQFTKKSLHLMRLYIQDLLPTRESLGLSDSSDVVLVGVGGTLRALAQYNQQQTNYPLNKVHNYELTLKSLDGIASELFHKNTQKIAMIKSIGSGRVDTITAGSFVIYELMKKLRFNSVIVGAQALREGTLALAQQYPKQFASHEINEKHVQDLISISCKPEKLPIHVDKLVTLLYSTNLISDQERMLLAESLLQIDSLSSFRDVGNVLYTILDDDTTLTHRQQLIVALSLIYSQKKKRATALINKYDDILKQSDRKLIKKISVVVSLCDIFYKTGVRLTPGFSDSSSLDLSIPISGSTFPEVLLQRICTEMEKTFGITITISIHYDPRSATSVD